ncbi:MAG: hypothetical protein ABR581_02855 [Thermoleophilaceae bacterium]
MEARSAQGQPLRHALVGTLLVAPAALALAACGTGPRQDEKEPRGKFPVEVTAASFPTTQKLAKTSKLVIKVRNAGSKTIPNLALTVRGFDQRRNDPRLADPTRPVFVLNGRTVEVASLPEATEGGPLGCGTAQSDTWACGPLKAGRTKRYSWSVTAVQPGPFKVSWRIAAGLNGKALAVGAQGGPVSGSFAGRISKRPPKTRVSDNGRTIINGTR